MYNKARKYLYVYIVIIAIVAGLSAYLMYQINGYGSLYALHYTGINASGLCTANKSTAILFYGNNCQSCLNVYSAFINTTSLFSGLWQGQTYYGQYLCAYAFNVTAYNANQSSVSAPVQSVNIFNSLSKDRIPMLFFSGPGGELYKIGGFENATASDNSILKYLCVALNDSAPQCS